MSSMQRWITDSPELADFGVDRSIFTDPALFEQEIRLIFEGTWIFVGLESQIPKPNSFFTTTIGRQPILVTRDDKGAVGCFYNSCRHRGTLLCPLKQGRQRYHVCRYHGWSYDSAGKNVLVTDERDGQYPANFHDQNHDLVPVPRFASYRGLLFASLNPDVPSLDDHLGDSRIFIDLVVDQSPVGQIEYVPGEISYTFDANWKLQFENGLDYYHFLSTHSSYVDILMGREQSQDHVGHLPRDDDAEGQGSFSFAHGHAVNWSIRHAQAYGRALTDIHHRVGEVRAKWMARQRNLTIFPNLQIIDLDSVQIRTWRPLAPDRTEMTSHCVGMVGESDDARRIRIRHYEEFFNPTGLASSDDNVMYELCQAGYPAEAGATQGYSRGLGGSAEGAAEHAAELGIAPVESSFGKLSFGGETNFHTGYREWLRLLQRGQA